MTVALRSFPECPSSSFGSHPTAAAMGLRRSAASLEKRLLMRSSALRICRGGERSKGRGHEGQVKKKQCQRA